MRITPVLSLAIGLLGFCSPAVVEAELLSKALLFFPASAKSLEYDNLAQLRKLPKYGTLREQYASAALTRAEAAFSKLGIAQGSIQEAVSTVGSADFYGIVSGTFSGIQAHKRASESSFRRVSVGKQRADCSSSGVCVLFLEDSVAAFGGLNDLGAMLQAMEGTAGRLAANAPVAELLGKADLRAPVIGIAPGSELATWIGNGVPAGLLSPASLSNLLQNITLFQYSVKLDEKAHLDLNLECSSPMTAATLRQSLAAINALHSVAANFSSGASTPSFENMTVNSNGKLVHLTLDAPIQ